MADPALEPRARELPALTGVRAIAAYLVFVHHLYPAGTGDDGVLSGMASEGHIGVTIFFVLSGFLITYRYERKFREGTQGLGTYFWNRFTRIYPLYALLTGVTLFAAGEPGFKDWLLQLSLTKGFFDRFKYSGIPQAWSLTVEETFYALAPLVFLAASRGWSRWTVVPLAYLVGAALLLLGTRIDFHGFFGDLRFVALFTFFGRAFEFFIGIALARTWSTALPSRLRTWVGLGGILAVLYALDQLKSPTHSYGLFHPAGLALNNLVLPVFIGVLFHGLITESTWLSRLLGCALFQQLGRSSYAFYLIHFGLIGWWRTSRLGVGLLGDLELFLLLNAVAWLLYRCFEEPTNRWLRRTASKEAEGSGTRAAGPKAGRFTDESDPV